MEPPGLVVPVQEEIDVATEPMEDLLQGEEQKQKPSTLPPLLEPQENGNATNATEDPQSTTLGPAAAPATDIAEQNEPAQGASAARAEHNGSPIPTAGTTTTTPHTPATPTGKPRPTLQGTLIGLFVAIDPATQWYVYGRAGGRRDM